MARRTKKRNTKIQKHESRIALKATGLSNTGGNYSDSVFVDVAQCYSIINRKLCRQGQMFRISKMRFYTQDDTPVTDVRVHVIPRVWPFFNAYRKGRALWHKMNAMAVENASGSVYPKYHDYKVFFNGNHYTNHLGSGDSNLLPVDGDDVAVPAGEWTYSEYSDSGASSDNYWVHVLGDHTGSTSNYTTVGLIEAYSQARAYPQADATVTDGLVPADIESSPWVKLFGDDDQTSDILNDLKGDNDSPPYNRASYPGGAGSFEGGLCVYRGRLQTNNMNVGSSTFSVPTFDAPLGLIRIELDAESSMTIDDLHITFEVEILGEI